VSAKPALKPLAAGARSYIVTQVPTRAPLFDQFVFVPLLALSYALILRPLILLGCDPEDAKCVFENRPENKIFWPILVVIALVVIVRSPLRFSIPAHIKCLFAYLAFAGLSVLWAYKPDVSAVRFIQQAMVVVCTVLPVLILPRKADLIRGMFVTFAVASFINLFYLIDAPAVSAVELVPGYTGYFTSKNYLGQFGAIAFMVALYECVRSGSGRIFGIVALVMASVLLIMSNSKTSIALAVIAPMFAGGAILLRRWFRVSPALPPWAVVIGFVVASNIVNISIYRLSFVLFGESTFTGRQLIWQFSDSQFQERPWVGWGYQSFWLVGPDAPSIVKAPGWVSTMPNSHNGYIDTMVEMGYVGLALLLVFVTATLYAIGRTADRDPVRAWFLLSLVYFAIMHNGLESTWMRAFEFLWIVVLFVAADVARQAQPDQMDQYLQAVEAVERRSKQGVETGQGSGARREAPAR
jgi:exopolysaccharide production protein ExoQ